MSVDEILEGLEEVLALERELGVRTIDCDRSLLKPSEPPAPDRGGGSRTSAIRADSRSPEKRLSTPNAEPRTASSGPRTPKSEIVFLHDRALSPKAVEMMTKIRTAMGLDEKTSPIVFTGERPAARICVVLGGNALRKWFPGVSAAPGQWISADGAAEVLVTYSPEYILRFGVVTPAVQEIKRKMWTSLKGVLQRLRNRAQG